MSLKTPTQKNKEKTNYNQRERIPRLLANAHVPDPLHFGCFNQKSSEI